MVTSCNRGLDNPPAVVYPSRMDPRPVADEMLSELAAEGGLAGGESSGRRQITKIRYSHDAMIDILVANPGISQNALAAHFGRTASWISLLMATDLFRARLAQRRAELVDPAIQASIDDRLEALVVRSQEVLLEKLSKPTEAIPDNLALRVLELGGKMKGLGVLPPAPPPAPDHLNSLANRLLELQSNIRHQTGGVVDVEAREVRNGESDSERPREEALAARRA